MKGGSRFKIPWREKEVSGISYFHGQKDSHFQYTNSSLLNKEFLSCIPHLHCYFLVFAPISRSLFTHHGSSSSAPKAPYSWSFTTASVPWPMQTFWSLSPNCTLDPHPCAVSPRLKSIRPPQASLNPVLFPHSPSHPLNPGVHFFLAPFTLCFQPCLFTSLSGPWILLNLGD